LRFPFLFYPQEKQMAEQMNAPQTAMPMGEIPSPQQAAEPASAPVVQVGSSPGQIPVDLSAFKDGQQVTVTLTCNVKASTDPTPENGQQGEVAAPSMSLEILSANAIPAKNERDAIRGLSRGERENNLDNELSKIQ
jgi:hypothetical protein